MLRCQAHCSCMQVPREAAEEAKEAVVAAGAKGSNGDGGLDMFADDVDADMFAGDPQLPQGTAPVKKALLDNYDDAEGYYNFQVSAQLLGILALLLSVKCAAVAAERLVLDGQQRMASS